MSSIYRSVPQRYLRFNSAASYFTLFEIQPLSSFYLRLYEYISKIIQISVQKFDSLLDR